MQTTAKQESEMTADHKSSALYVVPEVTLYEDNDSYLLEAEMPGVSKEGLEITLDGTEITLAGRRNVEATPGELLMRERQSADFRRVFELDPAIDAARISAKMDQGVLRVTLPKSERNKPRKIDVVD